MKTLALLLAAGLFVAGSQDKQQVFQATTYGVNVEVAVFDRDRVVTGLGPSDFEIYDNGVLQTVAGVYFNVLPIDLRLVFDTSGSITPSELDKYQRAMSRVAGVLRQDDRGEIFTFSARIADAAARQNPPLTIALQRMDLDGTSFFDAVSLAMITVSMLDRRQITIVLSDAEDNASFFDEATLLEAARRTDAVVYTIVPPERSSASPFITRLETLSLITSGRLVQAARDTQMSDAIIEALEEFRHSYVVGYNLSGVAPEGWHKLTVKVRGGQRYTVRAKQGYFGSTKDTKGTKVPPDHGEGHDGEHAEGRE